MIWLRLAGLPRWVRDFVPLLLLMGLIFYLSSQPVLVVIEDEAQEKLFYKSAHLLAYAGLAWLWWRALTPQRILRWQTLSAALVLTALYGISDEIHQLFVPGRHGRISDVLFDTAGALLTIILLRRWAWLRAFPESWLVQPAKSEGNPSQIVSSQ